MTFLGRSFFYCAFIARLFINEIHEHAAAHLEHIAHGAGGALIYRALEHSFYRRLERMRTCFQTKCAELCLAAANAYAVLIGIDEPCAVIGGEAMETAV